MDDRYRKNSLSLPGAIGMGTGVMIGAGIFALTGQVAELAGPFFPLAFLAAAIVSGFSAYSYVKMSNAWPSAGGIGMYLQKAYGRSTMTGAGALLMAISMVINESLVARTFGTYTLRLFEIPENSLLVPLLAVALIVCAFLVNISGNRVIGPVSKVSAVLKVLGILAFAAAALWASGLSLAPLVEAGKAAPTTVTGFIAATALAILAYKGFTTITNSGAELKDPHRNVGRAIVISLAICLVVYLLVSLAVGLNLSVNAIVAAKNYSLAEAARPALGAYGEWFTIAIAILATASGLIASVFAVSRMLAMLSDMRIIPHRHFGMPGTVQTHTLVYTVVLAALLAAFFDLSRIASLGAIFYLIMDISIHWGVLRYLRREVGANAAILATAILLDLVALTAFLWMKGREDPTIIAVSAAGLLLIFGFEAIFLRRHRQFDDPSEEGDHA